MFRLIDLEVSNKGDWGREMRASASALFVFGLIGGAGTTTGYCTDAPTPAQIKAVMEHVSIPPGNRPATSLPLRTIPAPSGHAQRVPASKPRGPSPGDILRGIENARKGTQLSASPGAPALSVAKITPIPAVGSDLIQRVEKRVTNEDGPSPEVITQFHQSVRGNQ